MISEQTINELRRIAEEWPQGAKVYHRANGSCGIVSGWEICGRDVLIVTDCGPGVGTSSNMPFDLTATKPADEGEEWKGAGA